MPHEPDVIEAMLPPMQVTPGLWPMPLVHPASIAADAFMNEGRLPPAPTLTLRCRHHRQDLIQTGQPSDTACADQCQESLRP